MRLDSPTTRACSLPIERRVAPRLAVLGRIRGRVSNSDLAIRIREMSLTGFSLEADAPLPAGVHEVQFEAKGQWSVSLPARKVHSHASCGPDGAPRYVTGFEFLFDNREAGQDVVVALVDRLSSMRPF